MSNNKKIVVGALVILLIIGAFAAYQAYRLIYMPNVEVEDDRNYTFIYIPTGADYQDVKEILFSQGLIKSPQLFEWMAEIKDYPENVKPGRYRIKEGINNNQLINLLRGGLQEPISFTFQNIRTKEDIAAKAGSKLEADSNKVLDLLYNNEYLQQLDFDTTTVLAMFIPNTYEFYWTTNAEEFIKRMASEYNKFWNEERISKARDLGLSPKEVSVLASIVQHETYINEDKPKIAGVYLNRLEKGMPLQADPTLIWALRDFGIRRVYNKYKEVDSPYNTYKYAGLPPGPIGVPDISSIDAVLNSEDHDYYYFVAKDDLSGYSVFSENYEEHRANARKYQRALDERNIN